MASSPPTTTVVAATDSPSTGLEQPRQDTGPDLTASAPYREVSELGHLDVFGDGTALWEESIDNDWHAIYDLTDRDFTTPAVTIQYRGGGSPNRLIASPSDSSAPRLPDRIERRASRCTPHDRRRTKNNREVVALWHSQSFAKLLALFGFPTVREAPAVAHRQAMFAAAHAIVAETRTYDIHDIVGRALGYQRSYIRDVIGDARRARVLTATTRGRAGGTLTAFGRSLLSDEEYEEIERLVRSAM